MRPTTILRQEDAPLLPVGSIQQLVFAEGDTVLATGQAAVPGQAKGAEQVSVKITGDFRQKIRVLFF